MADTYTIKFQCSNCGHVFFKVLPKGVTAEGCGGTCSVCGVTDGKPTRFKVIKTNKLQILREG
jgi:rubredoxin